MAEETGAPSPLPAGAGSPAPSPSALPGTSPTWGGVAQLGALALGVVYLIGLLVVNLHLGQYGPQSLDLARPEYALAGALWVLLAGAALWGVHSAVVAIDRLTKGEHGIAFIHWQWAVVGWALPVWIALNGVGYAPSPDAPWWVKPATTILMVATGASLYAIMHSGYALYREPLTYLKSASGHLDRLFNFVPLVLVLELGIYAAGVYPDLPREVGGGRRPTVQVVLSGDTSIDWTAAGVPFSRETKTVGPAMLLLDTPGSLVIVRPETWRERRFFRIASEARTVVLDRKLVAAVIYLPPPAAKSTSPPAIPAPSVTPPAGNPPPAGRTP